jgi:hypothetical protein
VGHAVCIEEVRNMFKILARNPEGKRPLERPGGRWDDNIKTYIKEIECKSMDSTGLAQNMVL